MIQRNTPVPVFDGTVDVAPLAVAVPATPTGAGHTHTGHPLLAVAVTPESFIAAEAPPMMAATVVGPVLLAPACNAYEQHVSIV